MRHRDPAELLTAARSGDRGATARLLSMVERGGADARDVGRLAYPLGGSAYTVGLTGAPGAGKSTLTSALIALIRGTAIRSRRCSPSTRPRRSPAARSSATGCACRTTPSTPGCSSARWRHAGHLGGLALATPEAIRVLDAVGQAVDPRRDRRRRPGRGRDRRRGRHHRRRREPGLGRRGAGEQGRPARDRRRVRDQQGRPDRASTETRRDLEQMLDLSAVSDWRPPIVRHRGVDVRGHRRALGRRSLAHRAHLVESGELEKRRERRLARELAEIVIRTARGAGSHPAARRRPTTSSTSTCSRARTDPWSAAERLLDDARLIPRLAVRPHGRRTCTRPRRAPR